MQQLANWLATSDTAEHLLSRLGAEVALYLTGDVTAFQQLLTSRPPGMSNIAPDWALARARDYSKALQQQRVRAGRGSGPGGDKSSDDAADGANVRRRKPKKNKKNTKPAGAPKAGAGGAPKEKA